MSGQRHPTKVKKKRKIRAKKGTLRKEGLPEIRAHQVPVPASEQPKDAKTVLESMAELLRRIFGDAALIRKNANEDGGLDCEAVVECTVAEARERYSSGMVEFAAIQGLWVSFAGGFSPIPSDDVPQFELRSKYLSTLIEDESKAGYISGQSLVRASHYRRGIDWPYCFMWLLRIEEHLAELSFQTDYFRCRLYWSEDGEQPPTGE